MPCASCNSGVSRRSKLKRTSLNISLPQELKDAIAHVPKYDAPTASAYVVALIVKDLKARNLLPP